MGLQEKISTHRSESKQELAQNDQLGIGNEKEATARASWGGKLEFILTCVGYAVGLGNVWRFPYLAYRNGGGAFLIPYVLMLTLIGIPIFFMEIAFGQFATLGPITIWKCLPLFKGLGFTMVIVSLLIGFYYNVIISWCVYYFFASMTSELPWSECGNEWNSRLCIHSRNLKNETYMNATLALLNVTKEQLKAPSEEYFYRKMLQISDGIEDAGGVNWQLALCLMLCWVVTFLVLIKGISTLGKVVYVTSIFPYVLLTVMLVRGLTLEGAVDGVIYYLTPNFSRLADSSVWSDACTQIFFSLSVCTGGLIAMSSYNSYKNNCLRDSLLVPIINCGTSFYSGFVIFSVMGYMAHVKGVSVEDVAAQGPGLVFMVYPEALSVMPVAPVWSVLFFSMMMMLGFSSEFSMVECFFAAITDEFSEFFSVSRKRPIIFRGVCCLLFCVMGLPMVTNGGFYTVNLFDNAIGGFPLLFVGALEFLALQYIYGYTRFSQDVKLMLGKEPNIFFRITWLVTGPVLLVATIVFKAAQYEPLSLGGYVYPSWSNIIYWTLVMFPLAFTPVGMVYALWKLGFGQMLKATVTPTQDWGPALAEHRKGTIYARKVADLSGSYDNPVFKIEDKRDVCDV